MAQLEIAVAATAATATPTGKYPVRTSSARKIALVTSIVIAAFGSQNALSRGSDESAAPVSAPEDTETCFSPDEPCALKLKGFIESAKTSLDIAIYDLNEDQIVHAVLVQSKKIPVRVIVDRRQPKGRHSSVDLLRKVGAALRFG